MISVEIWSDVVCPFCYMGKRRFEAALQGFDHREDVTVAWRSFQLDPSLEPQQGMTLVEYLAQRKGVSVADSAHMHDNLTATAAQLGLRYNFDTAVMANTLDAHRLTHLARAHGLQEKMEERLFAAYFTEGRNLNDHEVLADLGAEAGLARSEVVEMLSGTRFVDDVRAEAREAEEFGANGVPFFVFNRKYAVSGAQPTEVFLKALQQVWDEQAAEEPVPEAAS